MQFHLAHGNIRLFCTHFESTCMLFAPDMPSLYDDNLCGVVSKCHQAQQTYSPETKLSLFENRAKLKIHQFCTNFQTWNACLMCMTLHCFKVIYAEKFLNCSTHNKVTAQKGKTYRYSNLALTFNWSTWFLHITYRLDTVIIYAKLFQNSAFHIKVIGRKGKSCTYSILALTLKWSI